MQSCSIRAYAKVNLGLDVIRRLENGYHEVKMVMQTVDIYDELTFRKQEKGITITTNNSNLPTGQNNLIYKAASIIMEEHNITEGVHIELQKRIPIAAGMAGGSSDAAATFKGLNQLFSLHIEESELMKLGTKVGADVPYCMLGKTALAEGIGEKLTVLHPAPDCYILIAKPDVYVSTKEVYESLKLNESIIHPDIDRMVEAIHKNDLAAMCLQMGNVLESVTVKKHPVIEQIKQKMLDHGAINSLMSGSGPTVFGIFDDKKKADDAYLCFQEEAIASQIFLTGFWNGE